MGRTISQGAFCLCFPPPPPPRRESQLADGHLRGLREKVEGRGFGKTINLLPVLYEDERQHGGLQTVTCLRSESASSDKTMSIRGFHVMIR